MVFFRKPRNHPTGKPLLLPQNDESDKSKPRRLSVRAKRILAVMFVCLLLTLGLTSYSSPAPVKNFQLMEGSNTASVANKLVLSEGPTAKAVKDTETWNNNSNSKGPLKEQKVGIDPAYLRILEEAEKRSSDDFASSHTRGERGFVIGPTEGDFERHALRALRNARRIRNVLAGDESVKVAWMASPEHIAIVRQCFVMTRTNTTYYPEACQLWADGTLFDDVIPIQERETDDGEHSTKEYWLKALGGYVHAPYTASIFLDSDAYTCPGVQKLFAIANPRDQKYWQFPILSKADLAIGMDQYEWGGNIDDIPEFTPGNPEILQDFRDFPERNTGTVLFHFHRKLARTFAHFIPLVSEHVYNHAASKDLHVANDQTPFRIALYLFRRLRPEFVEQQIPMHTSCRTYPGQHYAGTDGFLNGMYPIQQDGKPCDECHCTPCLINHTPTHFVKVNGREGWEDSRFYNVTK